MSKTHFKWDATVSSTIKKQKQEGQHELCGWPLQGGSPVKNSAEGRWTSIKQNHGWDLTLCDPNIQLKYFKWKSQLACSHQSTVDWRESPVGERSLLNRCYRIQEYGAERKTIWWNYFCLRYPVQFLLKSTGIAPMAPGAGTVLQQSVKGKIERFELYDG